MLLVGLKMFVLQDSVGLIGLFVLQYAGEKTLVGLHRRPLRSGSVAEPNPATETGCLGRRCPAEAVE